MATPEDRSRAARIGALSLHAQVDSREHIRPARTAFEARFVNLAVELAAERGETLTDEEVQRRAQLLMRAHMIRLGQASARGRRKKSGRTAT